jgi:hypothetical protein
MLQFRKGSPELNSNRARRLIPRIPQYRLQKRREPFKISTTHRREITPNKLDQALQPQRDLRPRPHRLRNLIDKIIPIGRILHHIRNGRDTVSQCFKRDLAYLWILLFETKKNTGKDGLL